MRALVAAGAVFFFKNADRSAGVAEEQLAGDGKPHDSAADDEMVTWFQSNSPSYPVVKIRFTRANTCSSDQSGC